MERKRDEMQAQLEEERQERDQRLGPLMKEKQSLTQKIIDIQTRVQEAKDAEEAKTDELVRQYEEQYQSNQRDFDRER